jgi:osmotically-inducible protein OsmY
MDERESFVLRRRRVWPTALGLVLTYGIVACASTQAPRSEAERRADATIAGQVESALLADPTIYARHVDITVDRGVVHLGGYVWSAHDYQLARNDAASVPGVRAVDVEMELMRGGTSGVSR